MNQQISPSETISIYRTLADPIRRAILDSLRDGGQPVGDIARRFPVSRPAISKHLRIMRAAGVVVERKVGRQRICELNAAPLRHVDHWLNQYRKFWAGNLEALKEFVEGQETI